MKGTTKQKLALKLLTDATHRVVIYGGAAGGGKSFLGCFWILAMSIAYPGTRWFIGRKELKAIRQSTIITWMKVCTKIGFISFKLDHKDNVIRFTNGSTVDLLDMRREPSDPMFERFGSLEYTGGWLEEGGELDFGAFEVIKTRIGRHLNDVYNIFPTVLVTCNPKKNWLYTYFYKPFKKESLPSDEAFVQALYTDNPNLDKNYKHNLENIKDEATRARLRDGDWEYDDDPAQLISFEAASDYFTNEFIPAQGKKYITADIARAGKDKTVIRVWHGWRVIKRISLEGVTKTTQSSAAIKQTAVLYGVPMSQTVADEDGVGGGVVDQCGCKGFINNSRPVDGENFENKKAQCSYYMAKRIMERGVYEDTEDEQLKADVVEEMEQVRQKNIDEDGKIGIVPKEDVKKNIGRSPDDWDTIMMREIFELESATEFVFG